MERHSHAAGRSRSSQSQSQSQSPSHSAASASATSFHRKRKLRPSSDEHAPPLPRQRLSADDSDSNSDEDEFDDSSIRNFTAARLDNAGSSSVRTTKIKLDSSAGVKVETPEAGKDGTAGGSGAMVAGVVAPEKEDASLSSKEDVQNRGAYISREESLRREEDSGRLKFICVSNDGKDEHMVWLIGLKNIFSRQLPNMPKEYIVGLVMDRNHKSVMVIRKDQVVGGITYRPYISQKFGEIAFCAITADEQVKGYGTRLMNHLKLYARDVDGLTHFLTYADFNAVGYFMKQGFTKEIQLDKDRWHGYIKDYDGVILMECKIDPKLPYTNVSSMIREQKMAIDKMIKQYSFCHKVYKGDEIEKLLRKEDGIPKQAVRVEDIPGLREAEWTPDQYGHSHYKELLNEDGTPNKKSLTAFMRSLLKTMLDHPDVWPFKEPVDVRDAPDYYDHIRDPMDLKTMSKRVESEQYYLTLEMFIADAKRMFANARTYNSPDTIYYKCSTSLEAYFSNKVKSGLQALTKSLS